MVKKRAMSILLTLCMALCLVPASVFADGSRNIMLWIALFVISDCALTGAGYTRMSDFINARSFLQPEMVLLSVSPVGLVFACCFAFAGFHFSISANCQRPLSKSTPYLWSVPPAAVRFMLPTVSCTAISADSLRVLPDSRAAVRALAKTSPVP